MVWLTMLGHGIESAVIIIAVYSPTLHPFNMFCVRRRDTLKNSSQRTWSRPTNYQLHSNLKASKGPSNQRWKDPYATNMSELGEDDNLESRILPCHGVRKTYNVDISRATPSNADMPTDDLESRIA